MMSMGRFLFIIFIVLYLLKWGGGFLVVNQLAGDPTGVGRAIIQYNHDNPAWWQQK